MCRNKRKSAVGTHTCVCYPCKNMRAPFSLCTRECIPSITIMKPDNFKGKIKETQEVRRCRITKQKKIFSKLRPEASHCSMRWECGSPGRRSLSGCSAQSQSRPHQDTSTAGPNRIVVMRFKMLLKLLKMESIERCY